MSSLNEHQMARSEFIASGISRYKELIAQAEQLKQILIADGVTPDELTDSEVVNLPSKKNGHKPVRLTRGEGIPKGKYTWEDYIRVILRELGGTAKSARVIEYGVKANPRISSDKIAMMVRGLLSRMGRNSTLETTGSKQEGYDYSLKKDDPIYEQK